MPSRMIEPLRLSPKPRVITESWVLAQRVALGDAADVGQRVIQVARRLIADHLGRDRR